MAWRATAQHAERERDEAQAETARLRRALAFAASCIKTAEPWTETCDREIGALLKEEN